jgi:hypothetical protein
LTWGVLPNPPDPQRDRLVVMPGRLFGGAQAVASQDNQDRVHNVSKWSVQAEEGLPHRRGERPPAVPTPLAPTAPRRSVPDAVGALALGTNYFALHRRAPTSLVSDEHTTAIASFYPLLDATECSCSTRMRRKCDCWLMSSEKTVLTVPMSDYGLKPFVGQLTAVCLTQWHRSGGTANRNHSSTIQIRWPG